MESKKKTKIAAIYARVSGDRQKKEETIESQIDAIRQYAKANNYTIMDEWIFKDEAESGKFLDRPGLDALRDLILDGGVDVIIIHEPDRLVRKRCYQTLLIEEFEKAGVEVAFVKCKAPETPEEQCTIDMLAVFAEYERNKIADRCRRGRLYKAKMGNLSILPHAPYGFDYIREGNVASYEINPEKSDVVKRIFFLYTKEKYPLMAIGKYLDEKGIPTPKLGKHWDRVTIRDILKNEAYIGTAYFGKTEIYEGAPNRIVRCNGKKITKSRNARKERPQEAWIPISVPGFISESNFQLAQEQLETNRKFAARNTKELSLLQGLLVCKECGCSFYKKMRSKQKTTYNCHSMLTKHMSKCGNRALRQEELDLLVWNEIIHLLKNPSLLEQEIARRANDSKQKGDKHLRQGKIEKEMKQLVTAKDKLLDAYQEGNCLTVDELRPRMEKIRKMMSQLEAELKALNEWEEKFEKNVDFKATLEYIEKRLSASSEELSIAEKQKVVRLLIEEIVIGQESITIRHCIPASVRNQNSPLSGVCSTTASRLLRWLKQPRSGGRTDTTQ
jgi:site-specific DNA recombinase